MWAHLGMGYLPADRNMAHYDMSPYINADEVDPKWLEALNISKNSSKKDTVVAKTVEKGAIGRLLGALGLDIW